MEDTTPPHGASPRDSDGSHRSALHLSHWLMLLMFALVAFGLAQHLVAARRRAVHAAPAPAAAVDARGQRVVLTSPPRRIVSLTPANTEILFALGLQGRIVADTARCSYPPAARSLPHVGDMTISVEKVVAQRPDLVVASASANRSVLPQLERLHIPVFAIDPNNLAETYAAIRAIGRITGRAAPAEQVVRAMQARAERVRRAVVRDPSRPRVLFIATLDPLWVAGSATFIDDLIGLAGGLNAARSSGPGYHAYSPEKVVADRPDVILVDAPDAPGVRRRAGWSGIPAVRRGAVYSPDPDLVNRPGPRLADAVEDLARLLHPRAFTGGR